MSLPSVRRYPALLSLVAALALPACGHSGGGGGDGSSSSDDLAGTDDQSVTAVMDLLPPGPDMVKTCGDGVIEKGETCDDTNDVAGDGCSPTCQVEIGWQCPTVGMACMRQVYCGDGYVEFPETCDDGNSAPGDGCSGTCQLEPNYVCAVPTPAPNPTHEVCTSTIICGDGTVEPGEACDDGTTTGMGGCSKDCSTVEPGYTCPSSGGKCTIAAVLCGNAKIDPGEGCDDGNMKSGDGCSSTCKLESGYTCAAGPGKACSKELFCGDGILTSPEGCDDGNMTSGDGCSATCTVETNYTCPTPDKPCVSTVKCGDGKVTGSEQCDDGNTSSTHSDGTQDGCSSTCTLEMGWVCPNPGLACVAKTCGDGIRAGNEQCDLGTQNGVTGSGCSSTCTIPQGFGCDLSADKTMTDCYATVCGDGKKQGYEQCDDHNLIPYDSCSPTCTLYTPCVGGVCTAVCGDGLRFPTEDCDDGNTTSGDGCSSTCTVETGWMCMDQTQAAPQTLNIPILYRDMIHVYNGKTNPPMGTTANPDFDNPTITNNNPGQVTGLVNAQLGSDNEPVFLSADGSFSKAVLLDSAGGTTLGDQANVFCWWFHETGCTAPVGDMGPSKNPYDALVWLDKSGVPLTLPLTTTDAKPSSTSVYSFSSTSFFPLDGLGWNATSGTTQVDTGGSDNKSHNFSFTSELHYLFTYSASSSPIFTFSGDDDVWGFINGKLFMDLGGIHNPSTTTYTLDSTHATALGLKDGGFYSIDVFQAERHITGSDYSLSLQGFTHDTSVCSPICGDGVIEGNEVCDDGTAKNNGMYGGCSSDCSVREPYCGDGPPPDSVEQCDDGQNLTTYASGPGQCGPGCVFAPYCGDGKVSNGEQCDDGSKNGGTDKCTTSCTIAAQCGDGMIQGSEQCDDGANNGVAGDTCSKTCTFLCGNGTVDPGEACDLGSAKNLGGYGGCSPNCTLGGRCGDGIKNGNEACDNGTNSGAYGTCNKDCTLAPYCGDGTTNGTEQCDNGSSNSQNAYGQGMCTTTCQTAPYCGDGIVESSFGEQCDGVSSTCNATCMRITVIN